jgi:hypothetical protein
MIIKKDDNFNKIVKIQEILRLNDLLILFCQKYECLEFDPHFHAYEIEETDSYMLIDNEYFFSFHPINHYKNMMLNDNRLFIRPNCLCNF